VKPGRSAQSVRIRSPSTGGGLNAGTVGDRRRPAGCNHPSGQAVGLSATLSATTGTRTTKKLVAQPLASVSRGGGLSSRTAGAVTDLGACGTC
jgi:hypothetical protein